MRKILLLMTMAVMAACSGDELVRGGDSGFVLTVAGDASVETRAVPSALPAPLVSDFRLGIVDNRTGRVVYDGACRDFIAAGDGDYTLTATWGDDVPLGIDCPYYKGVARASITAADPTPSVAITCRVANALVSVDYDDVARFDDFFSFYAVVVERGEYSTLIVNPAKSAYMQVGDTPSLTFYATLRDTGREVRFPLTAADMPATLAAADNLVLCLSVERTSDGVILDVQRATVEHATVEDTLPLEWLPAPKATLDAATEIMRYEDEDMPTGYVLTVSTAHALQDVELTVDMADSRFASLNGTYLLSAITPERLALFAEAGVAFPAIGEQCDGYRLDLNTLIHSLRTNDGTITRNSIGLRFKANNRWSSDTPTTVSVEVRRLRFTLPPQAEGDAWSRTLYIAPVTAADIVAGEGVDVADVLARLQYEASDNEGATWAALPTIASGDRLMATLTPATTYSLRVTLPGTTLRSNTATQTMEAEAGVPNGDFERVRATYSDVELNAGGQYSVWPVNYQNTATIKRLYEPMEWATVNAKTASTKAANQNTWYVNPSAYDTGIEWSSYRSFGISYETNPVPFNDLVPQNGANAMVVRNVGWDMDGQEIPRSGGAFNTTYYCTNEPQVANRASGKLFLGSYSFDDGVERYNEGIEFHSRPSELQGYYKYVQDGDGTECGTVDVQLLNGTTVIGRGFANLYPRDDYGSFYVDIQYAITNLPATSLRVMFTSSRYASYDMAVETARIKCTPYNNTRESALRGATLTIDNLTFVY